MSSTGTDQHRVLSPHGPPSRFERGFMPLIVFAIVAGVVGIALDILQDLSGFAVGVFQLGALGPLAGAVAAWLFFRATLREILPAAVSRRQATAHLILGNGSVRQRLSVTIPVHAIAAVALILASGAGVPSEMVALAFLAATGSTALIFIAMFVAAQRKRAARAALADGQPAEA
jgi:hypothetical protein